MKQDLTKLGSLLGNLRGKMSTGFFFSHYKNLFFPVLGVKGNFWLYRLFPNNYKKYWANERKGFLADIF